MNCTDAVKILYDYDILNFVQDYVTSKKLYDITGQDKYLFEVQQLESDFDFFFGIGHFELDLLSSVEYLHKYFRNKSKVRERLKQRIEYYLSKVDEDHSIYFVTLTLRDEYLIGRDYATIRKDIREFVKVFSSYYVLNKDYGSTNFRLHFHGVIVLENKDVIKFKEYYFHRFGFNDLKGCNTNTRLLSAYIEKLSFHALKTSTKKEYREHIIYSRLTKQERNKLGLNPKYNFIQKYVHGLRVY